MNRGFVCAVARDDRAAKLPSKLDVNCGRHFVHAA